MFCLAHFHFGLKINAVCKGERICSVFMLEDGHIMIAIVNVTKH